VVDDKVGELIQRAQARGCSLPGKSTQEAKTLMQNMEKGERGGKAALATRVSIARVVEIAEASAKALQREKDKVFRAWIMEGLAAP
jgi:hypothetical protein